MHNVVDVFVEAKTQSKSSTGSRPSDRRNVLIFRRCGDDVFDMELPVSISPAEPDHCSGQPLGDLQADDATLSEKPTAAAAVTTTTDSCDKIPSSAIPSISINSDIHTEPHSLTKKSVPLNSELTAECGASSLTDAALKSRPRSLTKGEIPKFYSLNTSPPSAKCNAAASCVTRRDRKKDTNAGKHTKSKESSNKKTTASDKAATAKSVSDDRRLTFVVKETRSTKDQSVSTKVPRRSSIEMLDDCCNADIEDIMDQNEAILQDVSGCSDSFADDASNTLIPSSSDCCNVTLVPEGSCSLVSGILSSAQHPAANPGRPAGKFITDSVNTKPVDMPGEIQAGDVTTLIVTDMELTNINTSRSPVVIGSVSDNATFNLAFNSTKDSKPGSQSDSEQGDDKALSASTRSRSRKTITLSKQTKASTSAGIHEENVSNIQQQSENQPLENTNQEPVVGRQKQSVHARSKNQRTTTLKGPTVLPVDFARNEEMEKSDVCQGTTRSKTSANSKHVSTEAVVVEHPGSHEGNQNSHILQSSTALKVTTESSVEEQMADSLPKKVSAYMTKPGKIVYSTAHRRSSSTEPAVPKSRSKSRSILPLQSKPRSKQLLDTASLPVDSPSSAFSFDGTPKEDTAVRPAATLAARKKFITMDDSMVVSEPSEKPPLMRQRSLSSGDDISSSPHGIMLVLHNGKRTKPRMARSKSVRYGASETACTPPPVAQHKKLDVPLTPYARESDHPSSTSTDLANAAVGIVPVSPVFTSTSPVVNKVLLLFMFFMFIVFLK